MRAGIAAVGCMVLAACGGGLTADKSSSTPRAVISTVPVAESRAGPGTTERSPLELADLNTVVWADEVAGHDELVIDPSRPGVTGLGPHVAYRDGGVGGYLDEQHVVLADLSSDGHAEAVLPLVAADGTHTTNAGYLVFAPTPEGADLVGDSAFYHSFGLATVATVENSELVLRHSVGVGWEPPCCYSGTVTRRYRTDRTSMIETSAPLETGNLDARTFTVDRFYALLGQRNYEAAYAMLSAGELARTAGSQWPSLFTQAAQISTNMLSTPRSDGLIPFRLVVASVDGRTQSWQGGAALVYNPLTHSWLIDLLSLQPESI